MGLKQRLDSFTVRFNRKHRNIGVIRGVQIYNFIPYCQSNPITRPRGWNQKSFCFRDQMRSYVARGTQILPIPWLTKSHLPLPSTKEALIDLLIYDIFGDMY